MHFLNATFCIIAVTTVLLTSAKGLKFCCLPDEYSCVIEDWNPAVDGCDLFQHIPNATTSIQLINLQSLHFGSLLCNTITRYVDSIAIYDSPQLQLVKISTTCNILSLTVQNTATLFIDFDPNVSLTSVIVRNSSLTSIPVTLRSVPNIEYFIVENSNVENIDLSLFESFHHLKQIHITHGKLKVIRGTSAAICQCSVDSLMLDHNSLRIVKLHLFAPFASLTLLNLAHNRIEVLTGSLSNPILTSLLLNNNHLKVLDLCPWSELHHLNAFTIANNNLQQMPLCLNRFRNVTHVSMQFNQIKSIAMEQLMQLPNLIAVNLSFNNIASIPITRSSYPMRLQQLDIRGNSISNDTIPGGMIGSIDVLS